jgi:hypothetical protein
VELDRPNKLCLLGLGSGTWSHSEHGAAGVPPSAGSGGGRWARPNLGFWVVGAHLPIDLRRELRGRQLRLDNGRWHAEATLTPPSYGWQEGCGWGRRAGASWRIILGRRRRWVQWGDAAPSAAGGVGGQTGGPWRRRPRWRGRYPKIKGMWWRGGGVGQAPLAPKTAVVRASSEDSGYVVVWGKGCTLTQSLMHRKPYT